MPIVMKIRENQITYFHITAPKLKGRPRRKRKKRSASPGESSNESEASVASTSRSVCTSSNLSAPVGRPLSSGVRRSERKTSVDEKKFIADVQNFMNARGTPVGKMPLLGYKQIDLFLFYTKVQTFGGYDSVSAGRLWKAIYDDIGGNTGSTSAATITRRHYERLLLPYERYQRGEETKVRLTHGRRTKTSGTPEDVAESKQDPSNYSTESPVLTESPPIATTPPLQPVLSTSPFLASERPKAESGKISSLRSVRVKPERLKSLNTIIANSTAPANQQANNPLPSPPPSSNTSASTPSSTPSTTPTSGTGTQSVLERQLNSPLISQQVPSTCSPPGLPVSTVVTNATTVVTLTPPPEKDMKEIKLDPKQTNLLAQGKENIPLFGEKSIFAEKTIAPPRSPEVIDLETESDTSRDKIIIPSFKKRKLEILREGGLEVTAVELDARPSVIQSNVTPVSAVSKPEEKSPTSYSVPAMPNSIPKLISVTVTPDIGHMLPSPQDSQCIPTNHQHRMPPAPQCKQPSHHNNNNTSTNNNNTVNSRVINLGTSNNAALLQLYANANVVPSNALPPGAAAPTGLGAHPNNLFVPSGVPNGRIMPLNVTQSRSIFAHNENTIYGNPKEILIPPGRFRPIAPRIQPNQINSNDNGFGVLDLTQKPNEKPAFSRPSLEIVRVPVVPRPNPLNLEMRNSSCNRDKVPDNMKRNNFPGYQVMLDSRTIASNNLEITIVNSNQRNNGNPASSHVQVPSPPNRTTPMQMPRRQHHVNGKFNVRNEASASSYAQARKNTHPVIPNVPNLNNLNSGGAFPRMASLQQQTIDRRKAAVMEAGRDQQRRTSEGDKACIAQQQQQQQQQQQHQQQQQQEARHAESGRRHSVPSIPSGFVTAVPQNNPAFLPQLSGASSKFLPILDPMYYSAFYNGLFPPPMPPAAATSFLSPEFSAYYKELLASSQPRLGMTGQDQPAPTSK